MPGSLERDHQDAWYRCAVAERYFEREGFRRLIAWNLRHLRSSVPLSPATRVLSLGCGLGDYELALAHTVQHILALDLSGIAVAEAERRARARGIHNVEFRVADVHELDLPPASFDAIYALGTLHHLTVPDRRRLLASVAVWLTPNGWFYARDPNARSALRAIAQRFWRDAAFQSPEERPLMPIQLLNEAEAAGLDRCSLDYTDVLLGPLPWISAIASPLFWRAIAAADRAWLSVPGLRTCASQFALVGRRPA